MTVNNFAPAEYGGYVLGANSGGGGGGGLSEFDEFCGFTGSAHITLNLVLPQEDPGPFTCLYCNINVWDTSGEDYFRNMEIHFDNLHTNEIVVPVSAVVGDARGGLVAELDSGRNRERGTIRNRLIFAQQDMLRFREVNLAEHAGGNCL